MNLSNVPSFYFTPQIVLIDDDECFLETISDSLSQSFNISCFSSAFVFLEKVAFKKNFLEIMKSSRALNENSSDRLSIANLNYSLLSKNLAEEFLKKSFISIGFFDYLMPEMTGIDCIKKTNDPLMFKVLLTSILDNNEVISAFNENLIQHYIPKKSENLIEEIKDLIIKNHIHIIEKFDKIFFSDFSYISPYVFLFSNPKFINFYKNIINEKEIQFSCVYEANGSMIMYDKNFKKRFLNIYTHSEIENLLFESYGFHESLSDLNKKRCKAFELLVNYKRDDSEELIGSFLSNTLTDDFYSIFIGNEKYYIVFN